MLGRKHEFQKSEKKNRKEETNENWKLKEEKVAMKKAEKKTKKIWKYKTTSIKKSKNSDYGKWKIMKKESIENMYNQPTKNKIQEKTLWD